MGHRNYECRRCGKLQYSDASHLPKYWSYFNTGKALNCFVDVGVTLRPELLELPLCSYCAILVKRSKWERAAFVKMVLV